MSNKEKAHTVTRILATSLLIMAYTTDTDTSIATYLLIMTCTVTSSIQTVPSLGVSYKSYGIQL